MFFQAQSVLFVLVLLVISEHALVLLPPASMALDLQRHEIETEHTQRLALVWLISRAITRVYIRILT